MYKLILITFLVILCNAANAQLLKTIRLEIVFDSTDLLTSTPDSIKISYNSSDFEPWLSPIIEIKRKGDFKWEFQTEKSTYLTIFNLGANLKTTHWLLEPGDSVKLISQEGSLKFIGRGADKLNLQYDILSAKRALSKPSNPYLWTLQSLTDYEEWDTYLDRQYILVEGLFQSYRGKLNPEAEIFIKTIAILNLESQRMTKFYRLTQRSFGIDRQLLCKLFDRDFLTPQANWMRSQTAAIAGDQSAVDFVSLLHSRQYQFPLDRKVYGTPENLASSKYELAKKNYRGKALDFFLTNMLYVQIQLNHFTPTTEALLKLYYNDSKRNPLYTKYILSFEKDARVLQGNRIIPKFQFEKLDGTILNKDSLKGKVVVMYFRMTNAAQKDNDELLKIIGQKFGQNTLVRFLQIGVAKSKQEWVRGIKSENFQTGGWQNLFLSKKQDSILRGFNIVSYPAYFIMNESGRLVTSSFLNSKTDSQELVKLIKYQIKIAELKNWRLNNDGPYILSDNRLHGFQFQFGNLVRINTAVNSFSVAADEPDKSFSVALHDYKNEPCSFSQPEKLLALSDIEGNFDALRQLLLNNGVIDDDFNWIFGKGHVVFSGDMFDRGEQVTECLWLMYSLEEKAKAAGGYLHFILGNHELMNLDGNFKYVRDKYKNNSKVIGKSLIELYGKNSELGKWLRTKNIIEKVGDVLFLHAGISKEVNDLGLSIDQINSLSRQFYDNSKAALSSSDERVKLLFDTKKSPFWYRDYYLESEKKITIGKNVIYVSYKTSSKTIDEILNRYQVNKIITGHTVYKGVPEEEQGKYVTVHYNGKVINTDTKHAEGYSEALLIKNSKYYAVNKNGESRELKLDGNKTVAER